MFDFNPKRILYRIIIPFTLLFGVTTILSWFFSAYFITRYLDQSLKQQLTQVADVISKSSYVMNPAVLRQVKKLINAEVVIFNQSEQIVSTTFSDPEIQAGITDFAKAFLERPFAGKDVELDGMRYRTIIHPLVLTKQGQAFLSLWMCTAEADQLRRKIILGTGSITLFGILAMAGVGLLIARSITAPVEKLVDVTGKVSKGDLNERVRLESRDELGSLAASFNHMIDQLRAFEKKLVESEKLATAGRMAAGLAHEIRNPMTSIKMIGQVLQSRLKGKQEDMELLGSMVKEIDRLDRIVQEMINRTRPGELQRQRCDLNPQVVEVIRLAEESFTARQIGIEHRMADDLPKAYIDLEKIKQVLWNLILNANEAMSKEGKIIVSTGVSNEQLIKITVEDTGPGIGTAEPEQLFQPFFTTKPEGVGLGLTMSRKIVEKHGGQLTLENRSEGGAKAVVVLPVNKG